MVARNPNVPRVPTPKSVDQGWFNEDEEPTAQDLAEIEARTSDFALWAEPVIGFVRIWMRDHDEITADRIRRWCSAYEHEPPKGRSNWYGLLQAKLQRMGLERSTETYVSRVPSRNAARNPVWVKGPEWKRERARG